MSEEVTSEISKFYEGKNVFITGATGFMGKVLVLKLLKDCKELNKIIILIRNKKGKSLAERRDEFVNHKVFDAIRENEPEILNKILAIKGDVSVDGLAMNEDDKNMLIEDTNIVFHCAANVRFDQTLRGAVNFNTLGTLRILDVVEKMKNLDVFVHVSTSYCHCRETTLEERYYSANENPFGVIQMVKTLKDDTLEMITPKLLDSLPNTYAFTKGLTEDMVHSYVGKFKIAIGRPSIVTSSWKEPFEGWIEGFNGPTGLTLGAAKGVIRSMHCNPNYTAQMVPVDIVINAIIVMAYKRSKMPLDAEYYCNLTDYTENPMTWGESVELGKEIIMKYPMSQMLWFPNGSIKTNYFHHLFCSIFFHYLPAYFIDFMMIIFKQKPFLVNVQKRVSQGQKILQYYTTRQWNFKHDNFLELKSDMNDVDRKKFYCDLNEIDLKSYMENYIIGIRQFLMKESPSTLPKARKTIKILFYVDRTVKILFLILITYVIWNFVSKYF